MLNDASVEIQTSDANHAFVTLLLIMCGAVARGGKGCALKALFNNRSGLAREEAAVGI